MKKQLFTNAGFQALQAELYQLPGVALELEANLVLTGFQSWMAAHFDLSIAQQDFMAGLSDSIISFLSFQTSFALANRLKIVLDKPGEEKIVLRKKSGKIIRAESSLTDASTIDGDSEAGGMLRIVVDYLEP